MIALYIIDISVLLLTLLLCTMVGKLGNQTQSAHIYFSNWMYSDFWIALYNCVCNLHQHASLLTLLCTRVSSNTSQQYFLLWKKKWLLDSEKWTISLCITLVIRQGASGYQACLKVQYSGVQISFKMSHCTWATWLAQYKMSISKLPGRKRRQV